MSKWDDEYSNRGIPSSFRDEPSSVLIWALNHWPQLTEEVTPATALDIGCGTGRNAVHMARLGIEVIAFDSSEVALLAARTRLTDTSLANPPSFLKHDLATGIPAQSGSIALAADIFVYKHQLLPSVRSDYRRELVRVLQPNGRLLLSLAERKDGYYTACPDFEVSESGNPRTVIDRAIGVGSVLYSLEELREEMADLFILEMAWHKAKIGSMHGELYMRHTLATIWCIKGDKNGLA